MLYEVITVIESALRLGEIKVAQHGQVAPGIVIPGVSCQGRFVTGLGFLKASGLAQHDAQFVMRNRIQGLNCGRWSYNFV